MHLLAATPGAIDDGTEPVDLGQTPADIVFLSAADTELAALSEARTEMDDPPSLRLANLAHLRHPMSVDLHIEQCATKSKLVIARVLGGTGYWPYGVEQYAAHLHAAGVPLALLPGDDKEDPDLRRLSTVSDANYDALWSYLVEGGPQNAAIFLQEAQALAVLRDSYTIPTGVLPLLRAGLYWPGAGMSDLETIRENWTSSAPVVPIIFYRALLQGAGLNPINRLTRALLKQGQNPLPIFVASLKDPVSAATINQLFRAAPPSAILNCTAFAVGSPHDGENADNPLNSEASNKAPVFQVILSGSSEDAWASGLSGLSARDIAMNVALPEVDGRILSRAISFKGQAYFDEETQCPIAAYRAVGDRVDFVARLAANWTALRHKPVKDRRVALILANYPNKDGRLANGVGLDTPASTINCLNLLAENGYHVTNAPPDSADLMQQIMAGPTNWLTDRHQKSGGVEMSMADYQIEYAQLPYDVRQKIQDRWGPPEGDPFYTPGEVDCGQFALSVLQYGNVVIGLQPARGYNIDPTETYHSPDLVPPHHYFAFYFWLRHQFRADAIVHMGKHGNLEWLPGKSLALSEICLPEAVFGPTPHVYPFIVNDPGEGTQAKRRAQAVIIDHLTPPLTRAETYGPLRDLEALVDEYYEAAGVDPRRITHLRREIISLATATGLDIDVGMTGTDNDTDLAKLDAYLCELKEAQIRDGLHIFGQSPTGTLERDLAIALLRIPRKSGKGGDASLLRALAMDCGINPQEFDPLDCDMAAIWTGPRHKFLHAVDTAPWRSAGDTVERLEKLAVLAFGWLKTARHFGHSAPVLEILHGEILPSIRACGPAEGAGLLSALAGHFVSPGPSGAPTRGRPDVLPTGRNFFSVDSRAVPTPTAWALGWKSANQLIEKHLQDHGDWPRTMLLTAWGTANMRTGGDDIAQCLALMGVKPQWDAANRRVTGFEIIPQSALGRPRVDVTLRISGFFRDAFPQLIALVDSAARAVMALDESEDLNPAAARARTEGSTARVFGSKPGAYGAGLQAMIDERLWSDKSDLAEAYLTWGSYAYGASDEGRQDRKAFEARLSQTEAIVQNQDNREHDLLDSDDYYQFEGGAAAAVATLQGRERPIYHNDHSRPERPVIRTLDDEIGRVVRSRVVNPKWIDGVKRHGYKGAFEIAATVDYLFAFAATTGAVKGHHFDLVHAAFLEDDATRTFIAENNAPALKDIAARLHEAIERGLWTPKSNSARSLLDQLRA